MTDDAAAQLTLAAYAAVALAVAARQCVRSGAGWRVWLLYAAQRLYGALRFHWRANRHSPFPESGPGLIIANHRSPVDPLMIWMNHDLGWDSGRIRIIGFLMAREFYDLPVVGWVCRQVRAIPVARHGRDMGPVREALQRLQQGELIGIFPEGRINHGEGLLKAGTGVAWLALRARAPVYPVFIHGSPRGKNMVEPFMKAARVRVTYGEPIDLSAWHDRRKSQEVLQEVTGLLMRRLAELGGIAPPAGPDTMDRESVLPLERRG